MIVQVVSRQCKIGQKEGSWALTEIKSSSEYELESETSTSSSLLLLYTSLSLTLLLFISLLFYNMSQHNQTMKQSQLLLVQQSEQIVAIQAQIADLIDRRIRKKRRDIKILKKTSRSDKATIVQ